MNGKLKNQLKNDLINAALISATIIICLISSIYHSITTGDADLGLYVLAATNIVIVLATDVLSVIFRKNAAAIFNTVVYFLSSASWIIFLSAGRTDVFSSSALNTFLLIIHFPTNGYASLFPPPTLNLILTLFLFVVSLMFSIIPRFISGQHGKDKAE